ncbi:MAG TPA: hypothetical protein VFT59_01670 [Candidatus Saccharimonadales bacterium]|nr:hypothetical protein [Candidatus Saccharimonadales bacterium]
MCTSEDLVFGHGIDDMLHELHALMPGAFDDDPVAMVAALIWLDEQFELCKSGDYVLVTPGLMMWLITMVTPIDPTLAQAIDHAFDDNFVQLTTDQPFEVCFTCPDEPEYTEQYPEIVRGKNFLLRMMSQQQAESLSFLYTVRADDAFIYRPGFESRMAGHTQPQLLQDLSA